MPSIDPFAINQYGVNVQPIDWEDEFAPLAKTYHGLTIVTNGQIVGRITSWTPNTYSRENVLQYELSYRTYGRPVDQIPGKSSEYTIEGEAAELWDKEIEKRLAGDPNMSVFSDLIDQVRGFNIYEHWFKGTSIYRTWVYQGCWFNQRNEAGFTADGDARVMVNFTLQFVSRKEINA